MVWKLDLAAVVAAIACGVLWVEHGHHIFTDAPKPTELSTFSRLSTAAGCPENDNAPYPASCVVFLEGDLASGVRLRSDPAVKRSPKARVPRNADAPVHTSAAACPDHDKMPYSESCITFMTGWRWQPM